MARIKEDSAKKKRLQEKSRQIGEPENIFDIESDQQPAVEEKETKVEASDIESENTEEVKPRRPKAPKGKKYLNAKSQYDNKLEYSLEDAIKKIKKASYSSFIGTVEAHLILLEKDLKGTLLFPHGTGKEVKVAAIVAESKQEDAKKAGAEHVGSKELVEQIKNNTLVAGRDFNAVVATPDMMSTLASIAKILGPRGMMPNPKNNNLGPNVEQMIDSLKKGQLNYKPEGTNGYLIHLPVGKTSFDDKKLIENIQTLIEQIGKTKIARLFLSATMSPSVKVELTK